MATETAKQKLRRLMGRLPLDPQAMREADRLIEEMSDEDAVICADFIESVERDDPESFEKALAFLDEDEPDA